MKPTPEFTGGKHNPIDARLAGSASSTDLFIPTWSGVHRGGWRSCILSSTRQLDRLGGSGYRYMDLTDQMEACVEVTNCLLMVLLTRRLCQTHGEGRRCCRSVDGRPRLGDATRKPARRRSQDDPNDVLVPTIAIGQRLCFDHRDVEAVPRGGHRPALRHRKDLRPYPYPPAPIAHARCSPGLPRSETKLA